jgi:tetratricopeptide (TPR) repeat protein
MENADEEHLHKVIDASDDLGFLKFLTAQYAHKGKHHLVLQCLKRKAKLDFGNPMAHAKVANAYGHHGMWREAALAHERAAELQAADNHTAEQGQQLIFAGAAWLTAATKQVPATAANPRSLKSEADTAVDKQACIQAALSCLDAAIAAVPEDSMAWYYMALAHMAAKDKDGAIKAAQRAWLCCQGTKDVETRRVVAARLAKVLLRLCEQLLQAPEGAAEGKWGQLEAAAEVAVGAVREADDVEKEWKLKQLLTKAEDGAAAAGKPLVAVQLAQINGKLRQGKGLKFVVRN